MLVDLKWSKHCRKRTNLDDSYFMNLSIYIVIVIKTEKEGLGVWLRGSALG